MSIFKLHRVLKKYHQRDKQFVNLSNAQRILILTYAQTLQELNEYTLYLKKKLPNKNLIIVGFVKMLQKREKNETILFDKLITKKNLNFWNNPTRKDIEWIHSQDVDVLINLDLYSINVLNILTAASNAKIKCGCKSTHYEVFDFIINIPHEKDNKVLLEQILFYLNAIQVKN